MRRQVLFANLAAAAGLLGALVLRVFPPETTGWYPECPVWHYFHVLCPGCGATRSLAALTHARFAEAFHYNPLVVVLCPLLLGYFVTAYYIAMRREPFTWPSVPGPLLGSLCAAALLFGVARNILHFSIFSI